MLDVCVGQFPSKSLCGGLYSEGRFNGGFFGLRAWGLIFGGAHTWRGLFSEFYGISLQSATAFLLQSATSVITKCDNFFTKCYRTLHEWVSNLLVS